MYLDMVRIGEKVMKSCWYSLCVYKKKKEKIKRKRKEIQSYIVKEKKWKVEKKMQTKEVHELSSCQD